MHLTVPRARGLGRRREDPSVDERREGTSVIAAGRVVAALGLVDAFGHVSRRTAGGYEITGVGDLGRLDGSDVVAIDLAEPDLPPGAPGEAWLHSALYRARPDVGAVVRAQPAATLAVGAVTDVLHPLHGQAAWLGGPVPVHPSPRLLRSAELADAAVATLGERGAVVLRGNGAVTVGADVEEAVVRMHLLATACEVWLRASAAGEPLLLDEQDAHAWREAAPALVPRLWEHLVARTARR